MSIFASQYAKKYHIDNKIVREAQKNIYNGEVRLVAFSGKICSGKDTVADSYLKALGKVEKGSTFFAESLKLEITELMEIIREEYNNTPTLKRMFKHYEKSSISRISEEKGVSEEEAKIVYDLLSEDSLSGESANGFTRTQKIRSATQIWATDIRRKQDSQYWVRKTAEKFVQMLADGVNVVVTDVRFPNESQSVLDLGGIVVRLDVSLAEQQRRLMVRDGIGIDKKQIMHPSETALDHYEKFSVRVDTDKKAPKDVIQEAYEKLIAIPIDENLTQSLEASSEEDNAVASEPLKKVDNPEDFGLKKPETSTINVIQEDRKFPTASPFKPSEPKIYSGPKTKFPTKSPFDRGW